MTTFANIHPSNCMNAIVPVMWCGNVNVEINPEHGNGIRKGLRKR